MMVVYDIDTLPTSSHHMLNSLEEPISAIYVLTLHKSKIN
jgi:hypothetical protein